MENKTSDNQIIDSSREIVANDISEDENQYSIYNYIKAHPGSLAIIFSSMVAVVTFFAQFTAFINNKNILEYWNIDSSYASWNSEGLLYSALASVVYVIVVSLLSTWFSKTCDAYLEQKKLFVTSKLICKKYSKDYKNYRKTLSQITPSAQLSKEKLNEMERKLTQQEDNLNMTKGYIKKDFGKAKKTFIFNLLPNVFVLVILVIIRNFITTPQKDLLIGNIVTLVVHIFTYWLLFLIVQSSVIKKKEIKKRIEVITPEDVADLGNFKNEYPIQSLIKKGNKFSNTSLILLIIQTFLVCTIMIFSLTLLGGTEGSKKTFQIVDIDNQQYVVVFHEEETYYLEKAIVDGDKLEVYTDDQRIITASDMSFCVKTFDEVVKKESGNVE